MMTKEKKSFLTKGVPQGLLKAFDKKIAAEERYASRSEAIRELMRNFITAATANANNRIREVPAV